MTRRLYRSNLAMLASTLCICTYLISTDAYSQTDTTDPVCSSSQSDSDGDGWGWENNRSCIIPVASSDSSVPNCASLDSDSDGDGWGWENGRTCRVISTAQNTPDNGSTIPDSSVPGCASLASDLDGDGWGWENGRTCRVTSATRDTTDSGDNSSVPPPVEAAVPGFSNGKPICLTDASEVGSSGFGYENNRTCVVDDNVTATRNDPLLNQRSCIDWLEISYGNYRLQNNVWNESAVYSNNWHQCIEVTGSPGNYTAKWDYNWLQRNEGDEFAVKSYPQVYYGRKTRYNLSGTVEQTGLPESVNNLRDWRVEYNFSETGNAERNIAFESFFHTSCEAEEWNKQYEMMVWVGVPSVRTPGTKVATATLSNQEWDVYVNPTLGWAYVAFVAQQPRNLGVLEWKDFVDWSRFQGPANGVPAMAPNVCMGAIELGTETFWGTGTFTLHKFNIY